jgi:hypothetical protein
MRNTASRLMTNNCACPVGGKAGHATFIADISPCPSRPTRRLRINRSASAMIRSASRFLPDAAQAPRIHPDPEGARSIPDHHVDCALGRHPHGRRAWAAAAL